jgi:hypothetical protein
MIQAKRTRDASENIIDILTKKYIKQEKLSAAGKKKNQRNRNDADILSGKNLDEDPLSDAEFRKLQEKLFKQK